MPPALSDYSSDSNLFFPLEAENVGAIEPLKELVEDEEPIAKSKSDSVRATVTHPVSKKRKVGTLLQGLDPCNIIAINEDNNAIEGTPPKSSMPPTSSYRTRGKPKSELCYDTKYHPMDEHLQPARAARLRSKYEVVSEDSDVSSVHGSDHDESSSDVDHCMTQAKGKKRNPSPPAPSQGTRRSSRQVNRDVLYNTSVHPQDAELKKIEQEDDNVDVSSDDESIVDVDGTAEDDEAVGIDEVDEEHEAVEKEEIQQATENDEQNEVVNENDSAQVYRGEAIEIPDTEEDNDSATSHSSPVNSTPMSSLGHGQTPNFARPMRPISRPMRRIPFQVYEESQTAQDSKIEFGPAPLGFEHDDKENEPCGPSIEATGNTPPRTADMSIRNMADMDMLPDLHDAVNDAWVNDFLTEDGIPATDGANDPDEVEVEIKKEDDDIDSVLGGPSPEPVPGSADDDEWEDIDED